MQNLPMEHGLENALEGDVNGFYLKQVINRFKQEDVRVRNAVRSGSDIELFEEAEAYRRAMEVSEKLITKFWQSHHKA